MQLYGGLDSRVQGLSYPEDIGQTSIASFLAQNNSTGMTPLYLGTSVFRPDKNGTTSLNRSNYSDYYHPIMPIWDQFAFYWPLACMQEWFIMGSDDYVPSGRYFLKDDWKSNGNDMATPTMRQFMKQDSYWGGVEAHDDPDRMELNHFLDDDEPPGRPLL